MASESTDIWTLVALLQSYPHLSTHVFSNAIDYSCPDNSEYFFNQFLNQLRR